MYLNLIIWFSFLDDIFKNYLEVDKPGTLNIASKIVGGGWLDYNDKSIIIEGSSAVSKIFKISMFRIHKQQFIENV